MPDRFNGLGPATHQFASQRLTLRYLDWGNSDKPLLLLVHGGEDHARSWDWVAAQLRDDWHIVAPDLRGHGDSDWSPDGVYTMEHAVADLDNLIEHLGETPVTIVSHSLGGAISLRYTGLFPEKVRRIVAIEGLASRTEIQKRTGDHQEDGRLAWRNWIEKRRKLADRAPRTYATVEEAAERMRARNPHLDDAKAHHLASWGLRRREAGELVWKFDPYIRTPQPWDPSDFARTEIWGHIECPVLLVHGKESWAVNPAEDGRAGYFRDVRVESLERAGHWVQHDRLEDFVDLLRDFL